jgi:predicted O-methyltransferase YrrM
MGQFTTDWFGRYPDYWTQLFTELGWRPDQPRSIVEIGSFEGRSALWMLEHLLQHRDSRLHCIDIFPDRDAPDSYYQRFRANVLDGPHAAKVTVTASSSLPVLSRMVASGEQADFIYVDGSHRAAEVLEDLVLAFHATRPGGIIIVDDYLIEPRSGERTLDSPKIAVDAFTTIYRDRLKLPWGQPLYQLAMIKTAERSADHPGARGL